MWQAGTQAVGLPQKPAGRRREKASMAIPTARPLYSSSSPQAVPLSISGARQLGWPLRLPPLELVRTRPPQRRWLRRLNLLRLNHLCVMTTTTCTFAGRRKGWRQRIIGSPRRCSTRCLRALGHRMQRQFFTVFPVQLPAPASQQSCGDTSTISYARVLVLQPGGGGDTSVDTVKTEPHLKALTQHVAGRLAVPGAFAAAGVKVLMDSGSGVPAISAELVGALQGQPDVTQTPLTQVFVGHACVVTSSGQECDIETQSCPLHSTIETP